MEATQCYHLAGQHPGVAQRPTLGRSSVRGHPYTTSTQSPQAHQYTINVG
jgi:hypothetical protein